MTVDHKKIERFYEIDLLRFIAALSVVFFHYTFRGFAEGEHIPVDFVVLKDVTKYGYLGVDLFFIISGYVILMTAINRSWISFVISRITRLYPAFWVSVTLTAIIILVFGHPKYSIEMSQYFFNLSMISGFFGVEHVDGVYWSLLVELKFYFIIFLLIIFNQIRYIKIYLGLWLTIIIFNEYIEIYGFLNFFLFPEWAPYFIAGATIYLIRIEGLSIYKISLLSVSCVLAILNGLDLMDYLSEEYHTYFSPITISTCIILYYFFFLLMALGKTRILSHKSFALLGNLTYPLYLTHQVIGYIFFQHYPNENYKYVALMSMLVLSLLMAYTINVQIEQRYGRKFKALLEKYVSYLLIKGKKFQNS